jgi:hypothetical protein
MLNTLLFESQPSGNIKHIFWRHCRRTSRRIPYKKVFITNLCNRLSFGRLHLREYHLVLFRFANYFFLLLSCILSFFYFQFCIFIFRLAFLFLFCILLTTFYFGCISCSIILLSVFILKTKKTHKN